MSPGDKKLEFRATLLRPADPGDYPPWAFVVLPRQASAKLPRRGRTTVQGTLDGQGFQATLEPDGQLSHWLRVEDALFKAAGVKIGDAVRFEIIPVENEPEPAVPADFQKALDASPEARSVWNDTTTIARLDWIHWIVSARQARTRVKRIAEACDKLASGQRRVCCFDPSGYYSKALSAPKAADH
ncbi:YdeI/OmpD-associated family protein [Dokdonella sp.]|uniref:YdeI/OmpD-associated family protein n=1 Tax=Dokdonella sp. TaxID=2291710 RepID=UPI003528C117